MCKVDEEVAKGEWFEWKLLNHVSIEKAERTVENIWMCVSVSFITLICP